VLIELFSLAVTAEALRIFVPSFVEISPLTTEKLQRYRVSVNRRTTDGRTAMAYLKTYCLRRGFFDGGGKIKGCLFCQDG